MFIDYDKFNSAESRLRFLIKHIALSNGFKIDKITTYDSLSELKPIDQRQIYFFKNGGLELVIGRGEIMDVKQGEEFYNCALVEPKSNLIIYFSYQGQKFEPFMESRHFDMKRFRKKEA